ncbi:MAG: AtpZ/AtpI family protein [Planctomycetes bacterium]|nr:AtpZ/AtpI family protein [Planctomycetota bacterium]
MNQSAAYLPIHWYKQIVKKQTSDNNDHIESEIRIGWRMAGLGMEVSSTFAAGALLGWAFDHFRGTGSNGLLTGAIIGIVVGMWIFIRGALKMNRMLDRKHPTLGRGKPIDPDLDEDGSDGEGSSYD